jgi:hypothetical protein
MALSFAEVEKPVYMENNKLLVFLSNDERVGQLCARWKDEHEYEDAKDYETEMKKAVYGCVWCWFRKDGSITIRVQTSDCGIVAIELR